MPKYQREREIGIDNKYPWGGFFYASSRSKGFQITNKVHQQVRDYFENEWGAGGSLQTVLHKTARTLHGYSDLYV